MSPRDFAPAPEILHPRTSISDINAQKWVEMRRNEDNIDPNLWRIHDGLYNLNPFISHHPGGPQWLEVTKGTDITEAFEVAHVFDDKAKAILKKYYVKSCKDQPRARKYTFQEDGFYKTLKRKVQKILTVTGTGPTNEMLIIQDGLVVAFHVLLALTIYTGWFSLMFVSGLVLGMCTSAAHNFFHQKDNFRRYYWDISTMNSTDWRITHMLSHHVFTNSVR